MRDWTPGVEPCAETKSSRHCHLGRDSRFLYPLASLHCIFLFVYPLPLVRLLFPVASLRTDSRSLVHLVGDRLIRNLSPLFGNCPRNEQSSQFSYQFSLLFNCLPSEDVNFLSIEKTSRERRYTKAPSLSSPLLLSQILDAAFIRRTSRARRRKCAKRGGKKTVAKERVRETIVQRERSHVPESLLPSGQPTNA